MGEEAFALAPIVGFNLPVIKKKRNLPGTPDPEAEVVALSPKTLMATNRFICEICGKGFQRDQNLQLHRRGHNVPWKLRQRSSKEPKKRVYVCPEITCVHHQPLRALGDLTGIKKHFCRKHGEKKFKCEKCCKRYAVQSDWKAHLKTCGTREYRCDCGTIFSRRDSFLTHRAFCDALAEETARLTATSSINNTATTGNISYHSMVHQFSPFNNNSIAAIDQFRPGMVQWMEPGVPDFQVTGKILSQEKPVLGSMSLGTLYGDPYAASIDFQQTDYHVDWELGSKLSTVSNGEQITTTSLPLSLSSLHSTQNHLHQESQANMSATALLQKAAQIGATSSTPSLLLNFGVKYSCNNNPGDNNAENYTESFSSKRKFSCVGTDIVDTSEDDITATNLWEMYPSKRCKLQKDDTKDGQTRDFLGVGVQPICTPSINRYI